MPSNHPFGENSTWKYVPWVNCQKSIRNASKNVVNRHAFTHHRILLNTMYQVLLLQLLTSDGLYL